MFALRCTRKLLDRIPGVIGEPAPSTTVLGDWTANILFSRPQVILLVSEKSLLPIVIPAAPMSGLVVRFVEQLSLVLHDLHVPKEQIMAELGMMQECQIGKTVNRSVVRLSDDYMWRVERWLHGSRPLSLETISRRLVDLPLKVYGFATAGEVSIALFSEHANAARS